MTKFCALITLLLSFAFPTSGKAYSDLTDEGCYLALHSYSQSIERELSAINRSNISKLKLAQTSEAKRAIEAKFWRAVQLRDALRSVMADAESAPANHKEAAKLICKHNFSVRTLLGE